MDTARAQSGITAETRERNAYRLVLVASMPRAGSMWVSNVARRILATGGRTVRPDFALKTESEEADWIEAAFRDTGQSNVYCVKTHTPFTLSSEARAALRVLTPYRDVRDAALSFMRFMRCDFERTLSAARAMMALTDQFLSLGGDTVLPIRYEDLVAHPERTVMEIADFLAIPLEDAEAAEIAGAFSREKVKALIANIDGHIGVRCLDGSIRKFDFATGFQSAHITGQAPGEWREALDPDQRARLESLTREWLVRYGYPV